VGVLVRALIGGMLIALFTAGAVTAAVLLEVKDTSDKIFGIPEAPPPVPGFVPPTRDQAGDARTFLLLGSDERYGDDKFDIKPRSDTMLLVRADPDRKVVTVTSVPRDLRMPVPGFAPRTGKINEAYETKGANGTVKALEALFDTAGEELRIDHVLNVDFRGFRRAVNYVGGVYVDVDRRYFNDNMPPRDSVTPYATIDVKPGYQRLKGQDALDYVRYRHGDSDFLRAARQQDFLRQVKSQPAVRKLLRVQDRDRLGRVFGRYVQVDRSFRSSKTLIGLLRLALYMDGSTVQTVRFQGTENEDGSYVDASPQQLSDTLDQLLRPKKRVPRVGRGSGGSSGPVDYLQGLERMAKPRAPRMTLPFLAPSRQAPGSRLVDGEVRKYSIKTLKGRRHEAYRMVFNTGSAGEFYGVQGTSWRTPPILLRPDRIRTVRGRRLLTFSDRGKLRLVGWRTESGAYWVSNTLTNALSTREMLGIASTLREVTR
jgi:LCP family protein required for cell wall assembly